MHFANLILFNKYGKQYLATYSKYYVSDIGLQSNLQWDQADQRLGMVAAQALK